MSPVEQLISDDRWAVAGAATDSGPAVIRYRTPVLGPAGVEGYERYLVITWAYADEGTGELPDDETVSEMQRFDDHLCEAFEQDALAVLTAVLTFDGARQWVFYTQDVQECANRLSVVPDYHGEPYPIELTSEEDPEWAYLREQILGRVPADG